MRQWLPYRVTVYDDRWIEVCHREYEVIQHGLAERKPTDKQLIAMSDKEKIDHLDGGRMIYLYNDGCVPTHSKADWDNYCQRLRILARLKLNNTDPSKYAEVQAKHTTSRKFYMEPQLIRNALEFLETEDTCIPEYFNHSFAEFYATEDQSWIVKSLCAKIKRRAAFFQFFWNDETKLFTIEDLGDGVHLIDL